MPGPCQSDLGDLIISLLSRGLVPAADDMFFLLKQIVGELGGEREGSTFGTVTLNNLLYRSRLNCHGY